MPPIARKATAEVAATLPPGRTQALLALLHTGDATTRADNLVPAARPGWNLALRLCLERRDDERGDMPADSPVCAAWAERFLTDCDQLARAERVLAQCASGHLQLQLQEHPARAFVAWATSRRPAAEWRERADFDWWSAHLSRLIAPRLTPLLAERPRVRALLDRDDKPLLASAGASTNDPTETPYYRQLGEAYVARFANQHSYPTDATIGGATIGQYTDTLAALVGWLHREHDHRPPDNDDTYVSLDERELIAALAGALDADLTTVERTLRPFILDRDNAAYHGTLAGRAAPPLIRLDAERVAWSGYGLLSEPLIFLMRELRRRHTQEYHNSAYLREGVFRDNLYRLFADRRFARSTGRIELKRRGVARTDLDALVFDRKTGTLGVFELKAQDPFARSVEERQRQRDNFFHANHQVSAILEWVHHHGPDDMLARFDAHTAKRFRVQKVYVFVLGRYLAQFDGGPQPDRRAAWGSWAQVLGAMEDSPAAADGRNPLGTLFARLRDATPPLSPANVDTEVIAVGGFRLQVFPSFATMRSRENHPP